MASKKPTKGQPLNISASDWSRMLGLVQSEDRSRLGSAKQGIFSAPSYLCKNDTGQDVAPLAPMAIGGLTTGMAFTPTDSESDFNRGGFIFRSVGAPVDGQQGKFVIAAEAIPDGEIGRVWADGICPATIDLQNAWHRYADIEISNRDALSSYPGGNAEIVWVSAASGDDTPCVIRFGPQPFIQCHFSLGSALALTDASKSCTTQKCNIYNYEGRTITIYNHPLASNYMFEGATGARGTAWYDAYNDKWWMTQLECP